MEGTQVKAYKDEETGQVTMYLEGMEEHQALHVPFGSWLPKAEVKYVLDRETAIRLARAMGEEAGASEEDILAAIEEVGS